MEISDTYVSVSLPKDSGEGVIKPSGEGVFKDNGSRFIATAYQVSSEEQVKEIVAALKNEYHDARHHCYAYRLGHDGSRFRANDDGEPSGSAGRPILGQIDSAGLSDVLVVVVRYFGGIKLGIPGLIRAYRESAAEALANCVRVDKVATESFCLVFPYEAMNEAMKISREFSRTRTSPECGSACKLHFDVPLSRIAALYERVGEAWTLKLEENNAK